MKDNLENSIKQSLENFELPYNSGAWEAMNAKLDAASPSGESGSSASDAIKSSLENHEYPYNPSAWKAVEASLGGAAVGAGIEGAMKASLENHELPYNPEAWNSLESQLDSNKGGGKAKWYIAASAIVAAATVSYFAFTGSDTNETSPSTPTEVAQNISKQNSGTSNTPSNASNDVNSNNSTNTSTNTINTSDNQSVNQETHSVRETSNNTVQLSETGSSSPSDATGTITSSDERNGSHDVTTPVISTGEPEPSGTSYAAFVLPEISSVCKGTSLLVKNENAYNLSILFPNGSTWTGKANASTNLTTSVPGTYKIGHHEEGEFVEEGSFVVHDNLAADFEFVNLQHTYLHGLPTTEVVTHTPGESYIWRYQDQISYGTEAAPHFFKKGNYDIELTITGSNGCTSTVTKTVAIHKDYNLLAMNAFDPKSLDSRNNTYMPNALMHREDVKFTMIIVDPRDGHVMYETSDASQGWDGIDRSTGVQLDYQQTFIWKVTIENPEAGERPVYSGSAVIIPRQN